MGHGDNRGAHCRSSAPCEKKSHLRLFNLQNGTLGHDIWLKKCIHLHNLYGKIININNSNF